MRFIFGTEIFFFKNCQSFKRVFLNFLSLFHRRFLTWCFDVSGSRTNAKKNTFNRKITARRVFRDCEIELLFKRDSLTLKSTFILFEPLAVQNFMALLACFFSLLASARNITLPSLQFLCHLAWWVTRASSRELLHVLRELLCVCVVLNPAIDEFF